ncbi:hypothetical protein [Sneathiella sp.]|uniref:hypothetical protein n=1 Tax=Sneathiella sp. TaxID=1964365 RepID=UPI0035616329
MSGNLFKNILSRGKSIAKVSHPKVFHHSKWQVHFQDVLFGLANETNLIRLTTYEKSAGPSLLMRSEEYGVPVPFIVDPNSVQGNDDTTRVFNINPLTSADIYSTFPMAVSVATRARNGLFEVSLLYDDEANQWNPDKAINYLAKSGLEKAMALNSGELFAAYVKRRNSSDNDIINMYRAVFRKNARYISKEKLESQFVDGNVDGELTEIAEQMVLEGVENADLSLPSFTDVEFACFFFKLTPEDRYNMAVVSAGGHFIETEVITAKLKELLELKKNNQEKDYALKLSEFMSFTKGDTSTPSRAEKIAASLKELPVFGEIYKQNSSFMERNFEALCIKLDAYLLNRVKPSEMLGVNLQFPFVHDRTPHFMTLMFGINEDNSIKVEELLTDMSDHLSLSAPVLDPRLAKSIKICGTPSANLFVVENPDYVTSSSMAHMKDLIKLSKLTTDPNDLSSLRQKALYDLFSDDAVKLRRLNDAPIRFAAEGDSWLDRKEAMEGFLTLSTIQNKKEIDSDTPIKIKILEEEESVGVDGYYLSYTTTEIKIPTDVSYYDWTPILTAELPADFSKGRKVNQEVPEALSPVVFPEHIGAASANNTLTTKGVVLTNEEFKKMS